MSILPANMHHQKTMIFLKTKKSNQKMILPGPVEMTSPKEVLSVAS